MIITIAILIIGIVIGVIGINMTEQKDFLKKPNYLKYGLGECLAMIGAMIVTVCLLLLFPGLLPGTN